MLAGLISTAGFGTDISRDSEFIGASDFNQGGYFEEVGLTLLNDQIIRILYGYQYSFLHAPDVVGSPVKLSASCRPFKYDIDEASLEIPTDFLDKLSAYTGANWDVWGLSRMRRGGKWYQCYSKYGVSDLSGVLRTKKIYEKLINERSSSPLVVKDPRFGLTLGSFDFSLDTKLIYIRRAPEEILSSMRRHYGAGLFTKHCLPGTDYCSNHFNLKVPPQDYEEYYRRYEASILENIGRFPNLVIDYRGILDGSQLSCLEEFIGSRVDRNYVSSPNSFR